MDFKELEEEIERQLKEVKDDKNTEYEELLKELEKELEKQLKQVKAVQTINDQALLAEVEKEIQEQLNEAKMIHTNIRDITKDSVEKEVHEQLKSPENVTKADLIASVEKVTSTEPEQVKGPTWGETIMNDLTTEGKLPDWIKFMDKFMPPSVKAAFAVLETAQAITDNKDLIVDTGKKYIEVKLTEERRALEEQAKGQMPTVPTLPQQGGAFTYEDCVF